MGLFRMYRCMIISWLGFGGSCSYAIGQSLSIWAFIHWTKKNNGLGRSLDVPHPPEVKSLPADVKRRVFLLLLFVECTTEYRRHFPLFVAVSMILSNSISFHLDNNKKYGGGFCRWVAIKCISMCVCSFDPYDYVCGYNNKGNVIVCSSLHRRAVPHTLFWPLQIPNPISVLHINTFGRNILYRFPWGRLEVGNKKKKSRNRYRSRIQVW